MGDEHRATNGGSTPRDIVCYRTGGARMADLLIRDVPDEVVAAIDHRAARLGLSRAEYLRRQLARETIDDTATLTVEDLERFSETFSDLGDPEIMKGAWHCSGG
jgi:plasmid stability protein